MLRNIQYVAHGEQYSSFEQYSSVGQVQTEVNTSKTSKVEENTPASLLKLVLRYIESQVLWCRWRKWTEHMLRKILHLGRILSKLRNHLEAVSIYKNIINTLGVLKTVAVHSARARIILIMAQSRGRRRPRTAKSPSKSQKRQKVGDK